MLIITPEEDIPIPIKFSNEDPKDIRERANYAFKTASFLVENGLQIDVSLSDIQEARAELAGKLKPEPDLTPGKALQLKGLLSQYDLEVVRSAVQLRNYIKLRLLEHSDSPNDRTALKALELLGKLSDVNAFAENINVTVEHRTTKEIEDELVKKLSSYIETVEDVDIVSETARTLPDKIDVDMELPLMGKEVEDVADEAVDG